MQINAGPIKPIMQRLGEVLSFLPNKVTKVKKPPTYKQFIANMEAKITKEDFIGDIQGCYVLKMNLMLPKHWKFMSK